MHRVVGIVQGWTKLSRPGQTNGSYVAYNIKTTAKFIQLVTLHKVLSIQQQSTQLYCTIQWGSSVVVATNYLLPVAIHFTTGWLHTCSYKLHANYHKKLNLGTYTVCNIPASTDWLPSCQLLAFIKNMESAKLISLYIYSFGQHHTIR